MASKRRKNSEGGISMKKRRAISMEMKIYIITCAEKGLTATNISRLLQLNRSTVATIIKDKERIIDHVKETASMTSTVITKQRSGLLIEMERLLVHWLEDQYQRCIPVSPMLIQRKAKSLFEALKSKKKVNPDSKDFVASRGWFHRFKIRANLHNIEIQGEASGANQKAASNFHSTLSRIILEGGYRAEQVFNVDETGLFWKGMPNCTPIVKEEKVTPIHRAGKERLGLLLGANATGECKLKPMVVYQTENPNAFESIWKEQLPVIWRSNHKAWVTQNLFEDWFTNSFAPEVEGYCMAKGLPFKALLVLDNAPCHPGYLDDFHPNIRVVYLPPNTTTLLQPLEQGVISSFKAYYLQKTVSMAVEVIEKNKELTLGDFWNSYNIFDAIENIAHSWDEVKRSNINFMWKKLCPLFVENSQSFEETAESVTENIIAMSRQLNLKVEADDVKEILTSNGEELSVEDLIKLEKQITFNYEEEVAEAELEERIDEDVEEDEERNVLIPEPKKLTYDGLTEGFSLIEEGLAKIESEDPNTSRYIRAFQGVMDSLWCYKDILEEKKRASNQINPDYFFVKVEKPSIEPEPSTSAASLPFIKHPTSSFYPDLVEPMSLKRSADCSDPSVSPS